MISVEVQEQALRLFFEQELDQDVLRSILLNGDRNCLAHLPLRHGGYLPRPMFCEKCTDYKKRKDSYLCDEYVMPIQKETSKGAFFCLSQGKRIVLDNLSYRILASWLCAFQSAGITEILDTWQCARVRHLVQEVCVPHDEEYDLDFKLQIDDLFNDLKSINFHARKLEMSDFGYRLVSFSYLDEQGKHRQGDVKLCLNVPVESSFQLGSYTVTSIAGNVARLYSCRELSTLL